MSNFKVSFSNADTNMASYRDYEQRNVDSFRGNGGGKRGGRNRGRGGGGGFKKRGNRNYRGGANQYSSRSGPNPRSRFDDGDVSMDDAGGSSSRDRYTPYGRQGKGGVSKPSRRAAMDEKGRNAFKRLGLPISNNRGHVSDSSSNWWSVQIPFGAKASKDFILQAITDKSDIPFVPVDYRKDGNYAVFYIQGKAAASAILSCSKRISMPSGHKMMLIVRPSEAPELTGDSLETLKLVMSNRYDTVNKALNLRDLTKDAGLQEKNLFLPLTRMKVMAAVVNIIAEHIPELEALDLSYNRLNNLRDLEALTKGAPNLSRLILSHNQIKYLKDLERIKKFALVELSLDRNPCCDAYKDESSYVSAVQKIFPKVVKLDGHDVPPPITFNLNEHVKIPETKGSFFLNEQARSLVCLFLEQYFAIFDSGKREPLLEAYHDKAIFSLSAQQNPVMNRQPYLGEYFKQSRNLKRQAEEFKRQRTIKSGKLNILALLSELPSTQHDPSSMVVDVTIVTPALMSFCVSGLYKEPSTKDCPIRYFSRTFVTVPQGSGIVIVNEQFTVTNASNSQQDAYLKQAAPTPSSSPVLDPQAGPSTSAVPDANIQLEMVRQFSQQSGMNADFSQKCLSENNWEYDRAAVVFTDLKNAGKIPPEAFVQH